MGIDICALQALLLGLKHRSSGSVLTLGRQQIHRHIFQIDHYLRNFNYHNLLGRYNYNDYIEPMMRDFGFSSVESLDANSYENASIIHDMNLPVPLDVYNKYDFIFDGGTIEHIFNMPQVVTNIIDMLQVDGIFCSITCNNNFSGHGFYQFSPEFFLRAFAPKYGMEIQEIYIAKNNTDLSNWINVKELDVNQPRNTNRFNSNEEVYIITIAKKVSDNRIRILSEAPQQFSYASVEWQRPL